MLKSGVADFFESLYGVFTSPSEFFAERKDWRFGVLYSVAAHAVLTAAFTAAVLTPALTTTFVSAAVSAVVTEAVRIAFFILLLTAVFSALYGNFAGQLQRQGVVLLGGLALPALVLLSVLGAPSLAALTQTQLYLDGGTGTAYVGLGTVWVVAGYTWLALSETPRDVMSVVAYGYLVTAPYAFIQMVIDGYWLYAQRFPGVLALLSTVAAVGLALHTVFAVSVGLLARCEA